MKKFLALFLLIATTTTLLANPNPKTSEYQEELVSTQPLFNIKDIKQTPIKDIPVISVNDSSFNYVGFGGGALLFLPIPVPCINIGHREKFNSIAVDTSLYLYSLLVANTVGGKVKIFKYLDATYIGGGLSANTTFALSTPIAVGGGPFLSFGKESKDNFYEFDISLIAISNLGIFISPEISFSYGYKF